MSDETQELEGLWRKAAEDGRVNTSHIEASPNLIRQLMESNAEFFIEFFLAEQLDLDVPLFHKEIWGLLTDTEKERILLAIPRDHAKTTLAKLVVIWYWLFTPHRFCVYLSNTAPIAKGACRDIIEFLSHDNFIEVFGTIRMLKQSENEGLWIFELPYKNGLKRCVLRGLGQGQQMRGINIDNQRPDIAVVDDVEDNENTESEAQQKKLDKWVFGPFLKALARQKKIIWLGNMLSKTSLLARLSRLPAWNPVVFGALVRDSESGELLPLWPGKWTTEKLKEDFAEYKAQGLVETWMCEMMNMPGHGDNGFSAEQINYVPTPVPGSYQCAWITVDPAFGKQAHNDNSAISVHVLTHQGLPVTALCVKGKWDEAELFEQILSQAQYWDAWVWGIEAVAAQRLLIPLFNLLLAQKLMFGMVDILPLGAGQQDSKHSRVRAWVSLMAKKEWGLSEGDIHITTQIVEYDFTKKDQEDDAVDSGAYGPLMMDEYLELIQARAKTGSMDFSSPAQHGMEVAGV